MLSVPGYNGPPSDHFNGRIFVNREPFEQKGFGSVLKFLFRTERGSWEKWVENGSYPTPPDRVGDGGLRVTLVNHSTVLIQMDELNFLTDPIWSERCSPFSWVGPKRHRAPGVRMEDLPPIDYVLLSHNHYDHLDLPTLKKLALRFRMPIITSLGNKNYLEANGILNVTETDWGGSVSLKNGSRLAGVPARHFSGRGLKDRQNTLWMGFVIESAWGAVYFAADTGYGRHFEEIGKRFAPIRLSLLPIGAYLPRWFMSPVHTSPEEAVQAHRTLKAATSVAIHFGTFRLGADGRKQPVEDLNRALDAVDGPRPRFWALENGEGRDIPALSESDVIDISGQLPEAK